VRTIKWFPWCLIVVVFCIYASSLGIWAYADDCGYVLRAYNSETRWSLFATGSYVFRPLERLVNAINAEIYGYDCTAFTHAFSLVMYLFSIVLVFKATKLFWGNLKWAPAIAAVLFGLHPQNVMSVTQIDTVSQLLATVFLLLLVLQLFGATAFNSIRHSFLSFVLALLAFLSKETSLGAVFGISLSAIICHYVKSKRDSRKFARQYTALIAAIGVALLAYMLLRFHNGAALGSPGTQYNLSLLGRSLFINMGQLLVGVFYYASTLDFFPTRVFGNILISALLMLSLYSLIVFFYYSEMRSIQMSSFDAHVQNWIAKSIGLFLIMGSGLFPVVLIGKMSELYTFTSIPFFAIWISYSLGSLVQQRSGTLRVFTICLVVFLSIWAGLGTHRKVLRSREISDRAKSYFSDLQDIGSQLGAEEQVVCWQATADAEPPDYSAFSKQDRVIVRSAVALANQLGLISVRYQHKSSSDQKCDMRISVRNGHVVLSANQGDDEATTKGQLSKAK
jgi:hypothetical protein